MNLQDLDYCSAQIYKFLFSNIHSDEPALNHRSRSQVASYVNTAKSSLYGARQECVSRLPTGFPSN